MVVIGTDESQRRWKCSGSWGLGRIDKASTAEDTLQSICGGMCVRSYNSNERHRSASPGRLRKWSQPRIRINDGPSRRMCLSKIDQQANQPCLENRSCGSTWIVTRLSSRGHGRLEFAIHSTELHGEQRLGPTRKSNPLSRAGGDFRARSLAVFRSSHRARTVRRRFALPREMCKGLVGISHPVDVLAFCDRGTFPTVRCNKLVRQPTVYWATFLVATGLKDPPN
jgi:hypothetical protein